MSAPITIAGPLPRDEADQALARWKEEHPEALRGSDRIIVLDVFFTAEGKEVCRYRLVDPTDNEPELDEHGNNLSLLDPA